MIASELSRPVKNRMRSMTGYGSGTAESAEHNLIVQVEITSVNRKNLDIQLSSPKEWSGLDKKCAEWLKRSFERGRVNIQVKAQALGTAEGDLPWNEPLMEKALAKLQAFADKQGIAFEPDGQLLLQLAQSLRESIGLPDLSDAEPVIKEAFIAALDDLNSMRDYEGASLKADLQGRIDAMANLARQIEASAASDAVEYKRKLLERLTELGLEIDLDDERVLKEIAIFADRCDISEETTRLTSHFEQFKQLIDDSEPRGRKMDFLCQEIHREFNTAGSKAYQIEVKRAVIDGKNELERVREQVQNIE